MPAAETKATAAATTEAKPTAKPTTEAKPTATAEAKPESGAFGFIDQLFGPPKKPQTAIENIPQQVKIKYAVNLAPAGEQEPNIEWGGSAKGEEFATVIGRFYLWQKQDEAGRLLEMQADAAVVFYSGERFNTEEESGKAKDVGAKGAVKAIYVRGDVVMTEGLRTIRADEIYYDFDNKRGLAINATIRTFDAGRGIPIYVRAAKIRQLAEGKFAADNAVMTTSEFAVPQVSLEASNILLTDMTGTSPSQPAARLRTAPMMPRCAMSGSNRKTYGILLALYAKQPGKAGHAPQEFTHRQRQYLGNYGGEPMVFVPPIGPARAGWNQRNV